MRARHSQNSPSPAYIGGMTQSRSQPVDSLETTEEREARIAEESRLLNAAEAEAERVGTIPASEIRAWVESWGTPNEFPPPEPRK
jgi:predicted transcriptional regulator